MYDHERYRGLVERQWQKGGLSAGRCSGLCACIRAAACALRYIVYCMHLPFLYVSSTATYFLCVVVYFGAHNADVRLQRDNLASFTCLKMLQGTVKLVLYIEQRWTTTVVQRNKVPAWTGPHLRRLIVPETSIGDRMTPVWDLRMPERLTASQPLPRSLHALSQGSRVVLYLWRFSADLA